MPEQISRRIYAGKDAELNTWVHRYSDRCGAGIDRPPVRFPIGPDIIACFKREARERITELMGDMRESFPGYQMPTINGSITYLYQEAQRLAQRGQLRQAGAQRDTEERAEAAQRLIDTRKQAAELEAQARRERECRGSSSGEKERAAEKSR